MKEIDITWIKLDTTVLDLTPSELLNASIEWNSLRAPGENWLALIKPISRNEDFYLISLSLALNIRFTIEVQKRFSTECQRVVQNYSHHEVAVLTNHEVKQGNTGDLFLSSGRLLRILVPKRILDSAKSMIQSLLSNVTSDLVEQSVSD